MDDDLTTTCPECGRVIARPSRYHDDGNEYRCPACGFRHTRRPGDPRAFAFFPGDIYALVDPTLRPAFTWD